jgi:hypothetical protein
VTRRAFQSDEDPQAGTPAGLGGVPIEIPLGRHATGGARPPASRGPVPGGVAPGTVAPLPDTPLDGSGAAQSPVLGARIGSDAPGAGSTRLRRQRPAFVPMLRRVVRRCLVCGAPRPDHLVNCRRSGEALRTGTRS